jgi:hypothetical protein
MVRMTGAILVLKVENPHFTIRLYENLLKIDVKGSFKSDIEEALENKPVLKETIGKILDVFVPLHIRISEIDSVQMDATGKITVRLPNHRDIVIPFEHKEDAEKLVEKLNELISRAETERIKEIKARKRAEAERIQESEVRRRAERKRIRKRSDAERRV